MEPRTKALYSLVRYIMADESQLNALPVQLYAVTFVPRASFSVAWFVVPVAKQGLSSYMLPVDAV